MVAEACPFPKPSINICSRLLAKLPDSLIWSTTWSLISFPATFILEHAQQLMLVHRQAALTTSRTEWDIAYNRSFTTSSLHRLYILTNSIAGILCSTYYCLWERAFSTLPISEWGEKFAHSSETNGIYLSLYSFCEGTLSRHFLKTQDKISIDKITMMQ